MQILRTRPRRTAGAIVLLRTDEISPNPNQPRRVFEPEALRALADSIGRYGVLSPISVRRRSQGYELVAGERRLRAAKLAGLCEVPCVVLDVDEAESGAIALVENLQRSDLSLAEQAQGIARLLRLYSISQEECARRLGLSQSAVANKLRLLKLPEDVLEGLCAAGLSERHGRALLRLADADAQRAALERMVNRRMTAAAAESYVEGLLSRTAPRTSVQARFVLKDVRVFLNSLRHSVDVMRRGGVDVDVEDVRTEDGLVVTIRIRR